MGDLAQYAAAVRPAIDRIYVGLRAASRDRCRQVVTDHGVRPGFVGDLYFGLLARPMPADGFAGATAYHDADMTEELDSGVISVDDQGAWHLTPSGRALALALQVAIAHGSEESWGRRPIATMPGLAVLPRLSDLLGTLLDAGLITGGPTFAAVVPVYEPPGASAALRVSTRLGALRHHRSDAHQAAWKGAGLTLAELLALADGPQRLAIEDETNRRDAPIYGALTEPERQEFLATLAALP